MERMTLGLAMFGVVVGLAMFGVVVVGLFISASNVSGS